MVRKGRAAVDPDCPVAPSSHVLEDGDTIFDVLLNQTDIVNNHNKYYIIQLLQSDTNAHSYYVWTKWGRVGKIAGSHGRCDDVIFFLFCHKFIHRILVLISWTHVERPHCVFCIDFPPRSCGSRDEAEKFFCSKFHDKTKNHWAHRAAFESVKGKYTMLKRDYFAEVHLNV